MPTLKDKLKALLPVAPKTMEELRIAASEAATTAYELDELIAARDTAVEAAKAPYDSRIVQATKTYQGLVARLRAWAVANRPSFGKRQSYLLCGHALTFRQSPGKLEASFKDAALVESIIASGDDALIELAIAVKPALDKVAIKAALEGPDTDLAARLQALGFRVTRDEDFRFEPARV